MKIVAQSFYLNNKINFSSGLTETQTQYIKNLDVVEIEKIIKEKYNAKCDFAKSPAVAGFSKKTFDIFHLLDRKQPPSIRTFDFPVALDGDMLPGNRTSAYVIWADKNSKLTGRVNFNKKYLGFSRDCMDIYNKYCDAFAPKFANSHILQLFTHEFIHADHFLNLQNKVNSETINEIKKINYYRFANEILEKAGYYAMNSPFELYANYWSREICNSLDENFVPKYNPFEEPKLNLTPELRKFIDAIAVADVKAISDIANGKTKTTISFFQNDNNILKKAFWNFARLFTLDEMGGKK